MMVYMDSGFKNSRLSKTDWLNNWVDTKKKQVYQNNWLRGKLAWSRRTPKNGTNSSNVPDYNLENTDRAD